MKYTIIYTVKVSKRKEITQKVVCDEVWQVLHTIEQMGYTLKSISSEEK